MSKKLIIVFNAVLMSLSSLTLSLPVSAIDEQDLYYYSQNHIYFYTDTSCSGGASVCSASLPQETIKLLEDAGVKEKAEANMERYKYAEEKEGVPWQAMAALHFKEGGMASNKSISNGDELYDHINVDGIHVVADANEDAANCAGHFKDMAKMVYGIEVSDSLSIDEWGQVFLAYNRGFIYKNAGVDWKESPYPMNGFDNEHAFPMQRPPIESTAPMYLTGKDYNVGALAVFAYLCGGEGGGSSSGSSSSGDGSDVTIIGDSITNESKDVILKKLPNADIHAQHCKTVGYTFSQPCGGYSGENKSGLDIVKELKSNNTLRKKVAFLLGTNTAGIDKLQEAITEIGSDKDIYLMSLYETSTNHDSQNKTIKSIVDDNPNVTLIDWASKVKDNASSYLADGTHPNEEGKEILAQLIYDTILSSGGSSSTGTNGFSTLEEVEKVIMSAYKDMSSSELGSAYGLVLPATGDYHHNCVAFSTWFINHYTEISYTYPPNGKDLVRDFYNKNKSKYPDLKIDEKPSVYSIASWGRSGPFTTAGNHTGVVVGINEAEDTLIIAEANWNNANGTQARNTGRDGTKLKLSDAVGPSYEYININKYLKSNTGLK